MSWKLYAAVAVGVAAVAGFGLIANSTAALPQPAEARAGHGEPITLLDDARGVAFYTVEPDGFRVVATFGVGPGQTPVQFIATLAPDQKAAVALPAASGGLASAVLFERKGADALLVSSPIY
jgi:hypothetical protein